MRKLYSLFLISLLIFIPLHVSAEDTIQNISPPIAEMKQEIIQRVNEEVMKVNAEKERMKKQAQELKQSRDQFLLDMKLRQNTLKEEMDKKRSAMKEKYGVEREEFKEKLETLRNEKKKEIVEKLDSNISSINMRQTNHLREVLNKLSSVLAEFEKILLKAKAEGKDTSSADVAIAEAKGAIETAMDAVSEQAGKDYVITINTEENLRINVGETNKQLRADIKTVMDKVLAAKEAVKKAARAMHQLRKIGIISISPTRTITPTATAIPLSPAVPTDTSAPSVTPIL